MKLTKNIFTTWVLLVTSLSSNADAMSHGDFTCNNDQQVEITRTHIYIGNAQFKILTNSNGKFYQYKDDIAYVLPIDNSNDNEINLHIWNGNELWYNYKNQNENLYSPKFNLICTKEQ